MIGPLTRGEVTAIFSQGTLPVPVLALNHPDVKQLPIGDASEFGLLPEPEGAQAADHLIERGLRKVYVLVSTDDFAQRAAEAFKAELASRGGELAGSITLPPGATSYADIIAGMHFPTAPAAAPASASSTATPEAAVANDSGIFISMRPAQARLLLPQLRIAQVTLPVFATSHVYEGSDDAAANRDLDGVEFCDAPWLFEPSPACPATTTSPPSCPPLAAAPPACSRSAWTHGTWCPTSTGCAHTRAATCPAPAASSPPTSSAGSAAC